MSIREAWTRKYENAHDRIFGKKKKKKKNKEYKSDCCDAKITFSDPSPDFLGDNPKTMKVGTVHYICTKCGKECGMK